MQRVAAWKPSCSGFSLLHTTRSGGCAPLSTQLQCHGEWQHRLQPIRPHAASSKFISPEYDEPIFLSIPCHGVEIPSPRIPGLGSAMPMDFPPPNHPSEPPLFAQEGKSGPEVSFLYRERLFM